MLKLDFQVVVYFLLLCVLSSEINALRGTQVVLAAQARAKAAELANNAAPASDNADSGDTGSADGEGGEGAPAVNSTKPILTGIPQIDYVHDPNLPRELNGYNLSSYPFYNKVPSDITFQCDGLHDGFYASVPHKCQLYHHCLFGTRYDFLCANYTAFDQRTFICQFVSEVDCDNSAKFFKRNEALYKAAETTTLAPPPTTTTTTTTTAAPTTSRDTYRDRDRDYRDRDRDDFRDRMRDRDYRDRDYRDRDRVRDRPRDRDRDYRDRDYRDRPRERERERERPRDSVSHRKRKPLKRRRPVYEYYYDDVYADEEYEDELPPPVAKKSRKVIEVVKPAVVKSNERDYNFKRKSKYNDEDRSIAPVISSRKPVSRTEEYDNSRKPVSRSEEYDNSRKPVSRTEEYDTSRKPLSRSEEYDNSRKPVSRSEEYDVPPAIVRKPISRNEEYDTPTVSNNKKPVSRSQEYDPPVSSSKKPISRSEEYDDEYYEDEEEEEPISRQQPPESSKQPAQVKPASTLPVFSRPRTPPKISRPVPLNEKSKYEYVKNI